MYREFKQDYTKGMNMGRYTKVQFENDLMELNGKLERAGIDRVYTPGYRYGYAAVDWATAENAESWCINGTVCAGGTKKQMIVDAREDCLNHL